MAHSILALSRGILSYVDWPFIVEFQVMRMGQFVLRISRNVRMSVVLMVIKIAEMYVQSKDFVAENRQFNSLHLSLLLTT